MTYALTGLCVVLLCASVVLLLVVRRLRADLADALQRQGELERDLAEALKPPPPSSTVERYARRMIKTAGRVRSHGVMGLVQGTLEDIQSWADTEERAEIVHMAAADGTVTLFFSDIENSTALNDQLGDPGWVKVLAAHDRVLRARIDQYRGQVVKTAGDGFMVAFRDAEAACRAALAIQADLARPIDPGLRRHRVKVRIGIHTGQVVAKEGDYFGTNVAMAARVADLADGGEVLASDALRNALDDDAAVTLTCHDDVTLKGLPGEHRLWQVHPHRP